MSEHGKGRENEKKSSCKSSGNNYDSCRPHVEHNTSSVETISNRPSVENNIAQRNLRQKQLEISCQNVYSVNNEQCKYLLVDSSLLSGLVSHLNCSDYNSKSLYITLCDEKQGFCHKLDLVCRACEETMSSIYSSRCREDKSKETGLRREPEDCPVFRECRTGVL